MTRFFFCSVLALALLASAVPARAQEDTYVPGHRQKKAKPAEADQPTPSSEGRELFGPKQAPGSASQEVAGWSIMIKAYREGQEAEAREGLSRVQHDGGLPKAYLEQRGEATVIAYGQYDDPFSKQAQADLARVRGIEVTIDGQKIKPFAGAFLAPPAEIKGSIPEYDLRNVKKTQGDWALYTLQIGVYGRGDGKIGTAAEMDEFRRTAEKAVVDLRRQGDQAFYYHGPQYSSVTIGIFGKDDFDPETKVESPVLHELRKRYPYNLQNGMGIKQRVKLTDQSGRMVRAEALQPSRLVNVPKD